MADLPPPPAPVVEVFEEPTTAVPVAVEAGEAVPPPVVEVEVFCMTAGFPLF